jgi:hypothetical protein
MTHPTATVRAWNTTFKGDAATVLFNTISDLLNPKVVAYARSTCIINSSGTGKSRMVDELSMSIITLSMCLRSHGSRGIVPPYYFYIIITLYRVPTP